MAQLEFITTSKLSSEEFFNYFLDFEYYPNYFPDQIKDIKITQQNDNEIITEEKIVFSTIVKNVISQTSLHKRISDNELLMVQQKEALFMLYVIKLNLALK